jgi:hypothetical protein
MVFGMGHPQRFDRCRTPVAQHGFPDPSFRIFLCREGRLGTHGRKFEFLKVQTKRKRSRLHQYGRRFADSHLGFGRKLQHSDMGSGSNRRVCASDGKRHPLSHSEFRIDHGRTEQFPWGMGRLCEPGILMMEHREWNPSGQRRPYAGKLERLLDRINGRKLFKMPGLGG